MLKKKKEQSQFGRSQLCPVRTVDEEEKNRKDDRDKERGQPHGVIRQIGPQTTRSDKIGVKVKYDHRNSVTAKIARTNSCDSRLKRT